MSQQTKRIRFHKMELNEHSSQLIHEDAKLMKIVEEEVLLEIRKDGTPVSKKAYYLLYITEEE